jgi:hypothetical protein
VKFKQEKLTTRATAVRDCRLKTLLPGMLLPHPVKDFIASCNENNSNVVAPEARYCCIPEKLNLKSAKTVKPYVSSACMGLRMRWANQAPGTHYTVPCFFVTEVYSLESNCTGLLVTQTQRIIAD